MKTPGALLPPPPLPLQTKTSYTIRPCDLVVVHTAAQSISAVVSGNLEVKFKIRKLHVQLVLRRAHMATDAASRASKLRPAPAVPRSLAGEVGGADFGRRCPLRLSLPLAPKAELIIASICMYLMSDPNTQLSSTAGRPFAP